jgi:fumarate reductase subunit D
MAKSKEVFWWSIFSAGGVMSALFVPAFIILTGFILPYQKDYSEERFNKLQGLLGWMPVKIVLFGILFLSFFHCAHRFRHTAMDLGLRSASTGLGVVFYGGALACSALAIKVLSAL